MTDHPIAEATAPNGAERKTLELTGQQRLLVIHDPDGDTVQFLGRSDQLMLTVALTEQGLVLRFEGASIALQTMGNLSIEAEHLSLHGRAGASLSTGGDLDVRATGDLLSEARGQNLVATLGDVRVRANDDVKMSGERIRMNC